MTTGGRPARGGVGRRSTCRRTARPLGLLENVGGHLPGVGRRFVIPRPNQQRRRRAPQRPEPSGTAQRWAEGRLGGAGARWHMNAAKSKEAWLDQDEVIHLVRAAQRGDPRAVDLLLTRLRPLFLKFFARRIGRDAAEDAAQLALISIASALPGIDAERARSYVLTVARNCLGKARRRLAREARRFVPVELAEAVESPVTADREVEYHDLACALPAGLPAPPPALRDVPL